MPQPETVPTKSIPIVNKAEAPFVNKEEAPFNPVVEFQKLDAEMAEAHTEIGDGGNRVEVKLGAAMNVDLEMGEIAPEIVDESSNVEELVDYE